VAVLVVLAFLVSASTLVLGTRGPSDSPTSTVGSSHGLGGPVTFVAATSGGELARPSSSALGTVLSTIDLVANRDLPGNTAPAVQDLPVRVFFDSGNGDLYVRGYLGTAISVVNVTSDTVVTTIGTPASENGNDASVPTVAADTQTGYLYTANQNSANVSVINGVTNQVTGSVSTGGSPDNVLFDPSNGDLYVANWGGDNVTVISGATNLTVANIPVGTEPAGMLYDAASGELFVANLGSGNITVINTTSNARVKDLSTSGAPIAIALDTVDNYVDVAGNNYPGKVSVIDVATLSVAANITVGAIPDGLAYSPINDRLFVANGADANVTVIRQSTDQVVASINVSDAPQGMVFDPVNHDVYVLDADSYSVTVINAATDVAVATVATNNLYDYAVAVDPSSGNVFVANEGTYTGSSSGPEANVTVISGSTNRAIASVPVNVYPIGLTFDPANGDLIVADIAGNDIYLVDPATERTVGIVPAGLGPQSSAFDPHTGDLWVLNPAGENITVLNSALQPIADLGAGISPTDIAYDAANGDFYVTDNFAGDVSVFNGTTDSYVTSILLQAFHLVDSVLFDPHNREIYVTDGSNSSVAVINGATQKIVENVTVGNFPRSLAFDSANNTVFVSNYGSANVSVIKDSTNARVYTFPSSDSNFLVYDPANDIVYDTFDFAGDVNGFDAANYTQLGTIPLEGVSSLAYPMAIAYDPVNHDVYASTRDDGMISVISSAATYPVQFVEQGLLPNTPWSVTLNGTTNGSMSTTVGFVELNGTYTYDVPPVAGYTINVSGGGVDVDGSGRTVYVGFASTTGPTYPVTFQETGLPTSTSWSVTLSGATSSNSTRWINFSATDGEHSFSVGAVSGYSASPGSGTVTVSGAAALENITFTASNGAFTATLATNPSTLTLGASTTLTTTTSGGVAPFSYAYSALPAGCATANSSSLPCTPTATGTFTITVTVTDHAGHTAPASASLTVQSSAPNGTTSSIASWEWVLIVVIVIAAILIFLAVVWRRRKKDPTTPTTISAPPPPPVTPPSAPP
jgi:YVTN family beta-propeller protein